MKKCPFCGEEIIYMDDNHKNIEFIKLKKWQKIIKKTMIFLSFGFM